MLSYYIYPAYPGTVSSRRCAAPPGIPEDTMPTYVARDLCVIMYAHLYLYICTRLYKLYTEPTQEQFIPDDARPPPVFRQTPCPHTLHVTCA